MPDPRDRTKVQLPLEVVLPDKPWCDDGTQRGQTRPRNNRPMVGNCCGNGYDVGLDAPSRGGIAMALVAGFRSRVRLGSLVAMALALAACSEMGGKPQPTPVAAGPSAAQRAHQAAVDAYIYGYPLVTMEMTRRVLTNVAAPEGKAAPMGQIAKLRAYPT